MTSDKTLKTDSSSVIKTPTKVFIQYSEEIGLPIKWKSAGYKIQDLDVHLVENSGNSSAIFMGKMKV